MKPILFTTDGEDASLRLFPSFLVLIASNLDYQGRIEQDSHQISVLRLLERWLDNPCGMQDLLSCTHAIG
ncbi:MAG: hypothetical protein WCR13_09140 [Sphaerochaeta sp.]